MKPLLELKQIRCCYQGNTIVDNLSLHVNHGNLVCLLGPSGCGKTTVLRAIAGFEPVFSGEIRMGGQLLSKSGFTLPPEKRRQGMVFQDYALFPHMTVFQNVCFGIRHQPKEEQQTTGRHMLELVGMDGFQHRYPHELSGGQQQRIALARSLAAKPDLILMDEPFSSLDPDIRESLRLEVRQILKQEGVTGILVTHDQDEAFALGDQIGVMKNGEILQWDTPFNLYHEPVDKFVARFIGQGVFLPGTMLSPDTIETELGVLKGDRAYKWRPGTAVQILLRPDDVISDAGSALSAEITQKAFKGAEILYTLRLPTGSNILSLFSSHENHEIGDKVGISVDMHHMVAFAAQQRPTDLP
ncbi:MAG: ABC transporter ATP-binding protein [Gammaproteobacteria bacterium]|nr:ABC transporter ATP-binding protein [Gammaproteobacteria bacterium]MDH5799843.1 ABC transporter ATP-binding protein [Gammaproteobacteria bacterium]